MSTQGSGPVLAREDWAFLDKLQRATFQYFWKETNPANGLVPDSTGKGSPCSIAALGLALASYPVGVERGWVARQEVARRVLGTLRFLAGSAQGAEADATGHRGFFYHFLDMQSGRRAGGCELSTIDSAILFAGALLAAAYFDAPEEARLRELADDIYRRADWRWACNHAKTVSHGWTPERGFLRYRWEGYTEALLLYVLALGSPTHPLPASSYEASTRTYSWKKIYGHEHLYAGPLFIHQLPQLFIDLRAMKDRYMRKRGIDYFENSRRATYVHREYCSRNTRGFVGYGPDAWGITAGDGPGPARRRVDGVERRFHGYRARGAPYGPDDGTLAPWAAAASLPFAPEVVLPALRHFDRTFPEMVSHYGFMCSFNPTFRVKKAKCWVSNGHYGLDQGPIVIMIENQRSELLWRLARRSAPFVRGLRRAGFRGGWLDAEDVG